MPIVNGPKFGEKFELVLPESGTEFYVEYVWWDDRIGHFHISTTNLVGTRATDRANVFFPRRWTKVIVCEDIFTCSHA